MVAADNLPNVAGPFVEPSWNLPDVFVGLSERGLAAAGTALAAPERAAESFSVASRSLKGGGAVLMRIDAARCGGDATARPARVVVDATHVGVDDRVGGVEDTVSEWGRVRVGNEGTEGMRNGLGTLRRAGAVRLSSTTGTRTAGTA